MVAYSAFLFPVSVFSHLIMLLLFLSNLSEFLSAPELSEEIFVDVSRGSKLNINIDIVVPGISCQCKFNSNTTHLLIFLCK